MPKKVEIVTRRIPQIKAYLINRWRAETEKLKNKKDDERTSHIILGPPGVGKSQLVQEAAMEIAKSEGRQFVRYFTPVFFDVFSTKLTPFGRQVLDQPDKYFVYILRKLNEMEPADLLGNPKVVDELAVSMYFPHFWVKLCYLTPGFTVLDDFLDTQRADTISAGYGVAQERLFGDVPSHRDRVIVATSNTPEHSTLSRLMPTPLATRWEVHEALPPTLEEWCSWMQATYGDAWDKRAYAFLTQTRQNETFLRVPDEPETNKPYPCPRAWSRLARNAYFGEVWPSSFVGPEVGQQYEAFLATNVDINKLLKDPKLWTELEIDAKYMAAYLLSNWIGTHTPKDYPQSYALMDTILDESSELVTVIFQLTREGALVNYLVGISAHDKKYREFTSKILQSRGALARGSI
ncbi:MAG: hypothetical protein QW356_02080 [Candidatus Hadarchaeales archaeon]